MARDPHELAKEWQDRSKKISEVALNYDVMDDDDAIQQARISVQASTVKQLARELIEFLEARKP